MTQPPDDRPPMPKEPPETPDAPATEPPTVAWTPPPAGDPAVPPDATVPREPTDPVGGPTPLQPDEAVSASPILSATTTPPVSTDQAQTPTGTGATPIVGWQAPAPAAAAPNREGYVIAGVGARVVAWLFDALIVTAIPAALSFFLLDYRAMFRDLVEAARVDPSGSTFTIPITTDIVLITLISTGISFIYLVGFWTGSGATPGMRGLKLQVVDARTGGTLSVVQAAKRWALLGWPLGLLTLIPALQSLGGVGQFALTIVVFFTTIVNERRQGIHDKVAGSLVTRSVTSGDGATVVGCLVFGVLVILLGIISSVAFFAAVGPELEQLMIDIGNSIQTT